MECLKEILIPKRFSFYGYIIAVACGFIGPFLGLITGLRTTERRQFRCESRSSLIMTDQSFLQTKCYHQYDQLYNLPLPLYGYVLLTFLSLVVVSIIYSWWVRSRVDQVEQACSPDPENPQPIQEIRTRRVFWSYFMHLIVRFGLGVFFATFLGLQASNFPSEFQCQWDSPKPTTSVNLNVTHSNSSSVLIDCYNSVGREKTVWTTVVLILHIVFACLVLTEAFYLLAKACHTKDFMWDSKFCRTHLFNQGSVPVIQERRFILDVQGQIIDQTEFLEPLIPSNPNENDNRKAIDDIYIDVIIYSGRVTHEFKNEQKRHELMDVYLKPPKHSVRINNLEELFLDRSTQKSYTKILVVGRPGIGKSLLCTKLIREWSRGALLKNTTKTFKYAFVFRCINTCLQNTTKTFKYVFVYRFRHWNSEEMVRMSLKEFLSKAEHSSGKIGASVLQSIIDKPEEILFIFDGMDEFKHRENLVNDDLEFTVSNDITDEIPVSAFYMKLLKKKLLSGATVLTTTRPNAVLQGANVLKLFDKTVEILGFTPEKVQSYVANFCKDNPDTGSKIWQHIKDNMNLLYLCYIPVICYIVCSLLEYNIKRQRADSLPTTLTDVYKGALRLFIFQHNPEYQGQTGSDIYENENFSPSVEATLSKLGALARKGISERRMVFEKDEVQGMENCGLLNCMESKEEVRFGFSRPYQYCFIHLTLQEFIAARDIVECMNPEKVADFIKTNVYDTNWHLVIQFIAGLVQGNDAVQVIDCFVNTLCESLSKSLQIHKVLALLMMKSLYELHQENVVKRAVSELIRNEIWSHKVELSFLGMTPLDCTAIVYTLKHLGTHLKALDVTSNSIGDEGLQVLIEGIFKETNPLITQLDLNVCANQITDKGLPILCEALKHVNCQLTQLDLSENQITDKGLPILCEALKHDNCQLTQLDLGHNKLTAEGQISILREAGTHCYVHT